MKILGISGLPNSVDFKKKHFPHLTEPSYRITQGFDSAAALLIDNEIIAAAAEERFNRHKGTGAFPVNAIRYCLQQANLNIGDLDFITHGFCYEPYRLDYQCDPYDKLKFETVFSRESIISCFNQFLNASVDEKFISVPHHLAHAASSFFLSGFDDALIVVADGMGEAESLTLALGQKNKIEILQQIPDAHSLGILYGVFTLYLGFNFNVDEYKVMGLAPYGDKKRYFNEIMELIHFKKDGIFTIPLLSQNFSLEAKETYADTLAFLIERFGEAREPESEITQRHQDIAAALQAVLEAVMMQVLLPVKFSTGQNNLCMAGGVALNCTANAYIKRSKLFKNIFIQPAAGDDSAALGSALYLARQKKPELKFKRLAMPFYGPEFHDSELEALLDACPYRVQKFDNFTDLALVVARKISQGQIFGLFQGRMECGPRALGNRSILADPRDPGMRERINRKVKKREDFRPFAPAVIAEQAAQYFHIAEAEIADYKYMVMVSMVKDAYKNALPAVTHVDGTARVQTVFQSECPRFWQLIHQFGELTGIPILLNTSFNVRGQPIVCTPQEALQTFDLAGLDGLILKDYLVTRISVHH